MRQLLKQKLSRMINWVGFRFFQTSRTIWAKPRAIDSQELATSKDASRDQFLSNVDETKAVGEQKLG